MAKKMDYGTARARSRMAEHGSDNIHDFSLPGGLAPPRRRTSKAAQAAMNAAAIEAITRTVTCSTCGHSARVPIPPAKAGRTLRCSKCGARAGVVK